MFSYEKLDNNNLDAFNKLLLKSKRDTFYKLDFYEIYNEKSFISKYFIRKLVKLIIYNNKYIGYIWFDYSSNNAHKINDIYFDKDYLNIIDNNCLKGFNNNILLCEVFENRYSLELLSKLKMSKYKTTLLMILDNKNIDKGMVSNGIICSYKKKKDAKIRCIIQNSAFRENDRIPLTIQDIENDENQNYFIDDLCLFIVVNNKAVGYGQIIYSKGIYSVVNLGILKEYRGMGYGKDLLNALIGLAIKKGIKDLYIRVELTNYNAEKLYEKCGFKEVGFISSWLWSQTK